MTPFNDADQDSNAQALFNHVLERLAPLKLAFLHVIEGSTGGPRDNVPFDYEALRARYKQGHPQGAWVLNNGYSRQMALDAVAQARIDDVARALDIHLHLALGVGLEVVHRGEVVDGGYTNYPTLAASAR